MATEPSHFIAIAPDQLHAWFARLGPGNGSTDDWYGLLSLDERERAERFKFPTDRTRFVSARGILRVLLGKYLQIGPEAVEFIYGKNGKPMLAQGGLHFNLSHSADRALFAFSMTTPLGVDLERVKQMPDAAQLAARFFSPLEAQELAVCPDEMKAQAFFKFWTRKEAFIKATGEGLSYPLNSFSVSLDEPARLLHIEGDPGKTEPWTLHHLEPEASYIGAIATRQLGTQVFNLQFPKDFE